MNKKASDKNSEGSEIVSDQPMKMTEEDRLALELAKSRRETVLAQAKESFARNETAELAYKYLILQLYLKYHLDPVADAISENGNIIRGGAVTPNQNT